MFFTVFLSISPPMNSSDTNTPSLLAFFWLFTKLIYDDVSMSSNSFLILSSSYISAFTVTVSSKDKFVKFLINLSFSDLGKCLIYKICAYSSFILKKFSFISILDGAMKDFTPILLRFMSSYVWLKLLFSFNISSNSFNLSTPFNFFKFISSPLKWLVKSFVMSCNCLFVWFSSIPSMLIVINFSTSKALLLFLNLFSINLLYSCL